MFYVGGRSEFEGVLNKENKKKHIFGSKEGRKGGLYKNCIMRRCVI
jgi:hypothetical protein